MAGRCLHAKLIASALFATCVQQSWALPPFAGIDAAIEAASDLCSADPSIAEEADLAMRLQALVQGPVLSCGNSEGAFVDATTALWESGYAPDEGTKPALVLQVSGEKSACSPSPQWHIYFMFVQLLQYIRRSGLDSTLIKHYAEHCHGVANRGYRCGSSSEFCTVSKSFSGCQGWRSVSGRLA